MVVRINLQVVLKLQFADEKYVGKQLELIQEQFLRFYSDTTLKRCLPLKILLCSQLDHYSVYGLFDKTYNMYSGYVVWPSTGGMRRS